MLKIAPNLSLLSGPLVVALVYDGLCTFEFAIAAEIFGFPRPELGPHWYRFAPCGVEPGPFRAQGGLRVEVEGGIDLISKADLIVVPGWKHLNATVPPDLVEALKAAHARGARLAAICSGAFVLAATGLLDSRRATTHWLYAEALQAAYPAVEVDASVLYVEDARVMTSAGSAAGIDLMLHIIRSDFGAELANDIARRLVVSPHRSGGQAQFVARPVPIRPESRLAPLLDRIRLDPKRVWSIAAMAREAAMSERTFLRRFFEATGTAPGTWVTAVRIAEAERLLESSSLPIEDIASQAGFGSVASMRHHFTPATGLAPREYRQRFRHPETA